ncbi:MAG TPA: phasin family protein [Steroidobacteraceae bacterium]|nr:phasin family protein [Steroidobacteraceae bacterium]
MATRTRKKQAKASRIATAADAAQEQLVNTMNQVWLAGLGAIAKTQKGAPKLFEELVEEGARVHAGASRAASEAVRSLVSNAQSTIQDRVSDAREKASDALDNLEKLFQTRVQRALQQIGVPSSRDLETLSARVDMLNTNIERLARKRVGAKPRSNGRRSAAARAAA